MTKLRPLTSIITVLTLAAVLSGCPMNGAEKANDQNTADLNNAIVEGPTNISHQNVDFVIQGGVTQGRLDVITAKIAGLNIQANSALIGTITFGNVDTISDQVGTGEDATGNLIVPWNVTSGELDAAIGVLVTKVNGERERAREAREQAERIENERRQQVITQLSAEFAGYISSITFADVDVPGYELDEDSDPVTASVILPNNFTADQARAFIEDTVMESINTARATDTGPDPFHVFTDGAGNELSFFAEEGFDYTAAFAWVTLPGNQAFIGQMAPYVVSLTLKFDVDGDREVRLVEGGRTTIISDGSDIRLDLEWGQAVANGWLPPTHNGPTPEPFHVFTDAAGNELSFFAEEGFDYSAALAWVKSPTNLDLIEWASEYVASLTFKLNVDGNRQIRLNEEDPPRAVVISDGSGTRDDDLIEGVLVGMGINPPTHTMLNAISGGARVWRREGVSHEKPVALCTTGYTTGSVPPSPHGYAPVSSGARVTVTSF